jgi:4-hydroxybenzoate polyprenyltransferase
MGDETRKKQALNTKLWAIQTSLSRVKVYLALSRTPHGLLDMATPALGALLWLGGLPPPTVIALGMLTAFAGYTAVYALNDVVDLRVDREKIRQQGGRERDYDLDAVYIRHPLAQRLLTIREGVLWAAGWALLALIGAYKLNPACALIFVIATLLEALYCLLFKVSHLRTLVSGAVKTSGGIAAVLAVDPSPSPLFLLVLFLWIFFWEIGGQNVPNDLADIEEDLRLAAKTIPLCLGPNRAGAIVFGAALLSLLLNMALFMFTPDGPSFLCMTLSLLCGLYLFLAPAYRLYRSPSSSQAAALFNRASYYPLSILAVVIIGLLA